MPQLYESEVESKDFLGAKRKWQFLVIASDQAEMTQEVQSVMAHHEEITEWRISKIAEKVLSETSHFAKDYLEKGCHSYYE